MSTEHQPKSFEEAQVGRIVNRLSSSAEVLQGLTSQNKIPEITSQAPEIIGLPPETYQARHEAKAMVTPPDDEARERAEAEFKERRFMEGLGERRYRRVERISDEEVVYYSPEQVGVLVLDRMSNTLDSILNYGKFPEGFTYDAARDVKELQKVIRAQEEMVVFKQRGRPLPPGYPDITIEELVQMGDASLRNLVGMDDLLGLQRQLGKKEAMGAWVLDWQEQRSLDSIRETLARRAVSLGIPPEKLEQKVMRRKDESILRLLPEKIKQLKGLEKALLGFNHIVEFYQLQADKGKSVSVYNKILEERDKAQRGKEPPTGMDYEGIFEAPPLDDGTPPLGDLTNVAFKRMLDILEGEGNMFAEEPSDERREKLLEYLKQAVLGYKGEGGIGLNPTDSLHQDIADVAARLALFFAYHWDIHASSALKGDEGKPGRFSMEVSFSDMPKMHYPAVRAQNEWYSWRSPFGINTFSGLSPRLTGNFLEVVSLVLKEDRGAAMRAGRKDKDGEGKPYETRISLRNLLRKYGFSLKDIPWTKPEVKLDGDDLPIEARRELAKVEHRGSAREWVSLGKSRTDAFQIPYGLQLAYAGDFYEVLTTNSKWREVIIEAMGKTFWQKFNKPFDTGLKIYWEGSGLNEETVFKLILISKAVLPAAMLAAVQKGMGVTPQEQKALSGAQPTELLTGPTIQEGAFFSAVFDPEVRYLPRLIGKVKLPEGEYAIKIGGKEINTEELIKKLRDAKRGTFPGDDELIPGLFSKEEIDDIEEAGIFSPFSLDPKSPNYIFDALKDVHQHPKARA